jgi:hypothetical protein
MHVKSVDLKRLTKVLSLTQSDKDGEALAAFRTAEKILARSGIELPDLFSASGQKVVPETPNVLPQPANDKLIRHIRGLEKRISSLSAELSVEREGAIDLARQISVLQDGLKKKSEMAEGWRSLAWKILWEKEL